MEEHKSLIQADQNSNSLAIASYVLLIC